MGYKITRDYIPFGQSRSGNAIQKVRFLVAHGTGNPGSTAEGNVSWYSGNPVNASAHTFIDDNSIIEMIPLNEKAWHVNYGKPTDNRMYGEDANDAAIGVEFCWGGSIDFNKSYKRYVWYFAYLCDEFNLNPKHDIVAHSTLDPARRSDPENALNRYGVTWNDFISDVVKESTGKHYAPPKKQTKPEKVQSGSKWNKVSGNWHGQLLQRWDHGGAVRELQKLTSNNNPPFYPNNDAKNNGIDGYFGAHTVDCVKRYQSYYGLTVDGLAGKATYKSLTGNKSKPSKSIRKMAQEVIDGEHGNGHSNRRKSLGISRSKYKKVRRKVNEILSGGGSSNRKSIDQMADMIIQSPKAPNGHAARRKWLGISRSRYAKVRKEVNSRF